MLRSLVVPGWGQFVNGHPIKGAVFVVGEGVLGAALLSDSRALDRLNGDVARARQSLDDARVNAAVSAYNRRLDQFVARQWLLGGLVTYALVDAYVDAHFRNFELEFEHDPALPEGVPDTHDTRLFLRWTF